MNERAVAALSDLTPSQRLELVLALAPRVVATLHGAPREAFWRALLDNVERVERGLPPEVERYAARLRLALEPKEEPDEPTVDARG